MARVDGVLQAATFVVLGTLTVTFLLASRHSNRRLYTGCFLGLVTLNHGAEAALAFGGDVAFFTAIARASAAIDPVFLMLAVFRGGGLPRSTMSLVAVAAAAASALIVASWSLVTVTQANTWDAWRIIYTAFAYGAAWFATMRATGTGGIVSGAWPIAIGLAALPRVTEVIAAVSEPKMWALVTTAPAWLHDVTAPYTRGQRWALALAVASLLTLAVALAATRRAPAKRRIALWSWSMGTALTFVIQAPPIAAWWLTPGLDIVGQQEAYSQALRSWFQAFGRGGGAVRWLAFGLLATRHAFAHDLHDLDMPTRRRIARALVAAFAVGALAVGAAAVSPAETGAGWPFTPLETVLLTIVGFGSASVRRVVDRSAAAFWGVPEAGSTAAIRAYRDLVLAASHDASIDLPRERKRLGVPTDIATAVADAVATGSLGPGGTVAGRYHVERLLARTRHGRVVVAVDQRDGSRVAIKATPVAGAEDAEPLLREARLLQGIRHDRVVRVRDTAVEGGNAFVITDYAAGGSLAENMADVSADARARWRVALDVTAGLAAVHAAGLVHRDVTPNNVFLDAAGHAVIGDLDVAVQDAGATLASEGGGVVGTPGYLAPEVMTGGRITQATDVFSAGVLLRALFARAAEPGVDAVIATCLAADAGRRYPHAGALHAALLAARGP